MYFVQFWSLGGSKPGCLQIYFLVRWLPSHCVLTWPSLCHPRGQRAPLLIRALTIARNPPSWPHLNLITSQRSLLQIPPHWGLACQHTSMIFFWEGDTNIQSVIPLLFPADGGPQSCRCQCKVRHWVDPREIFVELEGTEWPPGIEKSLGPWPLLSARKRDCECTETAQAPRRSRGGDTVSFAVFGKTAL